LEGSLQKHLGVSVVYGKAPMSAPSYAFNKDRDQYHSAAIIRRLTTMLEPPATHLLGVVDVDLFEPDSEFVFGEADRQSKTAIISVARLREGSEPPRLSRRLQIEALSHVGHLVGMSYCDDPRCFMFLARTLNEADRKNLALCTSCRNELAKLNR
jgi:archaemetzincin